MFLWCRFCLLFLLGLTVRPAEAAQSGAFTYTVSGSSVFITALSPTAAGAIEIPAAIEGKNVTRIGAGAFKDCVGVTSFSIPAGVVAIGEAAFAGCASLSTISVAAGNGIFAVSGGVLFNIDENILMWYPPQRAGCYDVPQGVTAIAGSAFRDCQGLDGVGMPSSVISIGRSAFENSGLVRLNLGSGVETIGERAFADCGALTGVVIPGSVASIGVGAFIGCPDLTKVVFTGDAPSSGTGAFDGAASGFTIFFFDGALGFTVPTWLGYPCVNMGAATSVKSWLVRNHQAFDAPLGSDSDGDGVKLLMAYALALDPNRNLSASLPRPMVSGGGLAMDFYSGTAGITYQVQTSGNLKDWTSEGIILSGPDAGGIRHASYSTAGGSRFMRLAVTR